jgi:hypothetical protein
MFTSHFATPVYFQDEVGNGPPELKSGPAGSHPLSRH